MRTIGRSISIAFLSIVLLTVAAAPVAAAPGPPKPPRVVRTHAHVIIDQPGLIDCGHVRLDARYDVRRTIEERFDRHGNLETWTLSASYKGTITNPETGVWVRDDGSRRVRDDYRRETTTYSGRAHYVTWPDLGVVFADVGTVVLGWNGTPPDENEDDDIVLKVTGRHDAATGVCRALA